jgi:hypothetical protein
MSMPLPFELCKLEWADSPFVLVTGFHRCLLSRGHDGAHLCACGEEADL